MNTSNIHCTSYVNHPYTQVRDTLLANPHYVFRHATAAAAIGDAALHISLGLFDIGTDVAIEALREFLRQSPQKTEALLRHARVDRVERVIRPYLESLA